VDQEAAEVLGDRHGDRQRHRRRHHDLQPVAGRQGRADRRVRQRGERLESRRPDGHARVLGPVRLQAGVGQDHGRSGAEQVEEIVLQILSRREIGGEQQRGTPGPPRERGREHGARRSREAPQPDRAAGPAFEACGDRSKRLGLAETLEQMVGDRARGRDVGVRLGGAVHAFLDAARRRSRADRLRQSGVVPG